MSAIKKPALPTAAEVRSRLGDAERAFLSATIALGEALVVQQSLPDRDVSPEQDAVDAARQRVEQLKAMLPVIEELEAAALAGTRATLADDQRRGLERALRDLLKHSMSFSVHYSNAASAFKRMASSGAAASRLLFDHQKRVGSGAFAVKLSETGLRVAADREINRLGSRIDGMSAPGTTAVPSNFYREFPLSLEEEIRNLTKLIMASAPGALPALQAGGEGSGSSAVPRPCLYPYPRPPQRFLHEHVEEGTLGGGGG
jgi:hypothetical protein